MNKKIETSKKIALFSGICFAVVLCYSMIVFTYGLCTEKVYDANFLITINSITGASFATTAAFYYIKAKWENLFKIKQSFLKIKYLILKDIGSLDEFAVQQELTTELSSIEFDINTEIQNVQNEIISNETRI